MIVVDVREKALKIRIHTNDEQDHWNKYLLLQQLPSAPAQLLPQSPAPTEQSWVSIPLMGKVGKQREVAVPKYQIKS